MKANEKYVVVNENTLCHRQDGTDMLGVLSASLIRGGHNWRDGDISVTPGIDVVRAATEKDFETYRVVLPSDFSR